MSATMDRLTQDNPNVAEQLNAWQISRTRANEDAYDWSAFREHVQALGAHLDGEVRCVIRRVDGVANGRCTAAARVALPARAWSGKWWSVRQTYKM